MKLNEVFDDRSSTRLLVLLVSRLCHVQSLAVMEFSNESLRTHINININIIAIILITHNVSTENLSQINLFYFRSPKISHSKHIAKFSMLNTNHRAHRHQCTGLLHRVVLKHVSLSQSQNSASTRTETHR